MKCLACGEVFPIVHNMCRLKACNAQLKKEGFWDK